MLLIFDCDGVVLDSMNLHAKAESEAYDEIGIRISPNELSSRFSGVSQPDVEKALQLETGISIPAEFAEGLKEKKKLIFEQSLKPIPGIKETLDELLWDVPRCIASGSDLDELKLYLSMTDLYDLFAPHIFSAEMVSNGKPHPDVFLFASEHMKTPPDQCIVIEDSVSGVVAGKAAGMSVIGFVGGCHCNEGLSNELISAGADAVLSEMIKLPICLSELALDALDNEGLLAL
ncbi:MAG: HAD family phosphatase [Desulfobulbaceae bacterium]|nr:HAD family phosphatase [Desulfobulbaceae bacterium]